MLEVSSTDVIFDLKDDHLIPYKLEIKNTASAMLAYKIKTTNPGLFQVKPCKGILNGYQRETVEFCILDGPPINDRTLINEKFQIQAIKLNEKKSFAEIDQLFKTETVQMIKMATCVYKYQDGQKIPVYSDRLSVSRGNQGDQQEIVAKIRALDIEIMEKRMLREELFNKTPKKSSKINKMIIAIGLGLLCSQLYIRFDTII